MTLLTILASDYVNSKVQLWVPVLAIICDGEKFEFLVLDSGNKSVYSSGVTTGVVDVRNKSEWLIPTLKDGKVANHLPLSILTLLATEHIFDYFLMGYIN